MRRFHGTSTLTGHLHTPLPSVPTAGSNPNQDLTVPIPEVTTEAADNIAEHESVATDATASGESSLTFTTVASERPPLDQAADWLVAGAMAGALSDLEAEAAAEQALEQEAVPATSGLKTAYVEPSSTATAAEGQDQASKPAEATSLEAAPNLQQLLAEIQEANAEVRILQARAAQEQQAKAVQVAQQEQDQAVQGEQAPPAHAAFNFAAQASPSPLNVLPDKASNTSPSTSPSTSPPSSPGRKVSSRSGRPVFAQNKPQPSPRKTKTKLVASTWLVSK
jgi:hypothetical protein